MEGMEATQDRTILWHFLEKMVFQFEMIKFESQSNCTQIQILGLFWIWQLFTIIRRRESAAESHMKRKSRKCGRATHGKNGVILM